MEADVGGHQNALIGNGVCNEETNHAICIYDGGDCCESPLLIGKVYKEFFCLYSVMSKAPTIPIHVPEF